jgi:hypothetical protein
MPVPHHAPDALVDFHTGQDPRLVIPQNAYGTRDVRRGQHVVARNNNALVAGRLEVLDDVSGTRFQRRGQAQEAAKRQIRLGLFSWRALPVDLT